MFWLVFWLTAVGVTRSLGCLKCSLEAMRILNEFKSGYLEGKLRQDPELRTKIKKFMDSVIEGLSWQPIRRDTYMGVIDEVTLEKLTAHFKRSINRIVENQFDDGQLFNEVMWSTQDLKATFERLMKIFMKIYCSNDCGVLSYLFISCHTCASNVYKCSKTRWCGERKIVVEANEDLILDCALKWHKVSYGTKKYAFYRIVDGGKQELMTSGPDSFLVKKEANKNDTGRYHCKTLDPEGWDISLLNFQVTVLPPAEKTTWFTQPHPTLEGPLVSAVASRSPLPHEDWTVWLVIGSTAGFLFLVAGAFLYFYHRKGKEKEEEEDGDNDEDEEEDDDESESESSKLVKM